MILGIDSLQIMLLTAALALILCSTDAVKHFPNQQTEECALYMAESSIPGAGLGIFTAVDIAEGDKINEPELLLPLISQDGYSYTALNDHVWSGVTNQMPFDAKADISFPGIGSHINCHQGLINTVMGRPKVDSAGLHRGKDPGAGAFSYYHAMHMETNKPVKAGSELFIAYGDGLEPSETCMGDDEELQWYEYEEADEVLTQVMFSAAKSRTKRGSNGKLGEFVLNAGSWDLIRKLVRPGAQQLLPERVQDVYYAAAVGTAHYSLPNFIRSRDWFHKNGMCIDNLYPDQSTIPQAGRGAFSKRFLPKGSVVSPAPLVHMAKDQLDPYYVSTDGKQSKRNQIHWNYCFGHPQSSILLLPHAPVVNFINHDAKRANVQIRWSESKYHKKEWLQLTAEQLVDDEFIPGLMIEYVALRDVQPGEEIFLNYGSTWEQAWNEHVQNFSPSEESASYKSASNLLHDDPGLQSKKLKTVKEQKENPYPPNVYTACYFRHGDKMTEKYDLEENMACLRPCKILARKGSKNSTMLEAAEGGTTSFDYFYTAEMYNLGYETASYCKLPRKKRFVIHDVPSQAVTLLDRQFTMDSHLPWAFRHEMGVPEGFYPQHWMDLV